MYSCCTYHDGSDCDFSSNEDNRHLYRWKTWVMVTSEREIVEEMGKGMTGIKTGVCDEPGAVLTG